MKELFVNTWLGHAAISARRSFNAVRTALRDPENAGNEANDYIAAYLMARLCRPECTFLDVGAHIGSVIAEVSRHCPRATIEAVEADPGKATALQRRFPDVTVHSCAVADEPGELTFYLDTQRAGYSSLLKPASATGIREIVVPVRRLDDLVACRAIDVIKIDVEGAELRVLRGASQVIAANRPTIIFESVGGPQEEWRSQWNWLKDRSYDLLVPNRVAHTAGGLSDEGFVDSHFYPRRASNYFAIAHERLEEIRVAARNILGLERSR